MQRISVYIVDDHKVLVDGLSVLLSGEPFIEIVGKNTDPLLAVQEIKKLKPSVLLTDIQMPEMSGIELTKQVKRMLPDIKVLALSMFGDYAHINEMINAGVNGYILKNSDKHEVLNAISAISKGEKYLSETVTQELLKASQANELIDNPNKPNVTSREREIIQLIAKEYSNAQIAEALFISERTVETHRKNIFRKTNTKSVVGLLKYAMEQNFL